MPQQQDMNHKLTGKAFISAIDAKSFFHQSLVHEDDEEKFTVISHRDVDLRAYLRAGLRRIGLPSGGSQQGEINSRDWSSTTQNQRRALVTKFHSQMGHKGRRVTFNYTSERYWWPKVWNDVCEATAACPVCQNLAPQRLRRCSQGDDTTWSRRDTNTNDASEGAGINLESEESRA
ncbi:hypothetical protein XA68_13291 [Ophiocordyceps unilateralis]|uniref:Integrase zinc-binding domain-containing protein n=1 Tax=Ophiocordyceps unilateralis TaxID=268505 RepID=A0A2A9PCK0_OPHUN|nr:hypothetical protein XA68_13291 [Ophiocordyceps unilateralis]